MVRSRPLAATLALALAGTLGFVAFASAATTYRIALEQPFGNPPKVSTQYAFQYLEKALPTATNGAVDVNMTWGAALGNEKQLIKSVATGTIDATAVSAGNAASLIPEAQLFSASYLFNSFDHVRRVLKDDKFFNRLQEIVAARKTGFVLGGVGLTGTRNFYDRVKPVKGMEDMKGLKMRVMSSPTEFKVWSTLGTLPQNIPAPEIYTAIQTGVVDAAESSLSFIVANKYYEVAPYITLTNHQFSLHLLLVGDRALDKVPEAVRPAVMKAFREAGFVEIDAAEELRAVKLKFLESQPGVTVTQIDTRPFAKILGGIQDEVAKKFNVEDLLAMIRAHE